MFVPLKPFLGNQYFFIKVWYWKPDILIEECLKTLNVGKIICKFIGLLAPPHFFLKKLEHTVIVLFVLRNFEDFIGNHVFKRKIIYFY